MRIGIIGSGIAGLTCAHVLAPQHDVTLFEAAPRPGGHSHTWRVDLGDERHLVDTGFLVYNERNYPGFVRLLADLGVTSQPSDMSFSVADATTGLEWRSTSVNTVFAQRRNILSAPFRRMLVDIVRFNRRARRLLGEDIDQGVTLQDLLDDGRWSDRFVHWYLLPMASAIWSADPDAVLRMPASTLVTFFDNHGLLRLGDQPRWRTLSGGAISYVRAITEPLGHRLRLSSPVQKVVRRPGSVEVVTERHGPEVFDHLIVATHSDQALRLLADPTDAEREVLGAISYQPNLALLHTDGRLLPRNRRARASWNYRRPTDPQHRATLTYHLNRLQSIESRHDLCVTLNRSEEVDPSKILAEIDYSHPVLDAGAVAAQRRYQEISGRDGVWFCGAYWGFGFHEDGLQSALRVCRKFGATL